MSDYVSSPPLVLTTLEGAAWLADPARYRGQPGDAFINAIRVRVTDRGRPDAGSAARLASIAAAIHHSTGLTVDVVVGSSTKPVTIALAAGSFGRPALEVDEQWSVLGVAVQFAEAIANFDQLLLIIVVGTCLGSCVASTSLSLTRRRTEFWVLGALGWARRDLERLVVGEVLIRTAIAVDVCFVGSAIANVLGNTRVAVSLLVAAWVAAALGIAALLVGLWLMRRGAGQAARARAKDWKVTPHSSASTIAGMALLQTLRIYRRDTVLCALGSAAGATAVGSVALVAIAFGGGLGTSVLGVHIALRVGPLETGLGILGAAFGILTTMQIFVLSFVGRKKQLGVLLGQGWGRGDAGRFVAMNAAVSGVTAGAFSVLAVVGLALLLKTGSPALAIALGLTGLVVIVGTVLAVGAVLVGLIRTGTARTIQQMD